MFSSDDVCLAGKLEVCVVVDVSGCFKLLPSEVVRSLTGKLGVCIDDEASGFSTLFSPITIWELVGKLGVRADVDAPAFLTMFSFGSFWPLTRKLAGCCGNVDSTCLFSPASASRLSAFFGVPAPSRSFTLSLRSNSGIRIRTWLLVILLGISVSTEVLAC